MYGTNEKYETIILSCFERLVERFTTEQSFHIMLGASTIRWANMSKKYSPYYIEVNKIEAGYDSPFMVLQRELNNFEYRVPEFHGVLTGIMNKIYIYKDKAAENKLKEAFNIINSIKFDSQDEMRKFINRLVSIGTVQCGFVETPESIRKVVTDLVDFSEVRSFADYCSGTSSIAIEVFEYIKSIQTRKRIFYYGEEFNATSYLISKILMIINEIDRYEIVNKDVLEYTEDEKKLEFDFIVSDMPQVMYPGRDLKIDDPRFQYGIPSRSSADWAFGQNVIYHISETGKGVVIGTKGTLVRGNEAEIRKGILNDDLIECVITLPDNLYGKTSIGTELIIFNKSKSEGRQGRVLFINAGDYAYRINRNQHAITDEGINKIIEAYRYGIQEDSFSKFVDLEKIKEYNYTLNPKEYLDFDVLKNSFENTVALRDVAQINRGVQISKEDLEELSKGPTHYLLNVKDIDNGRILYDEDSKITFKKYDWIGKYDIRPDDIILTSKGSSVKIAIVGDNFEDAFISGNLTILRVYPEKYNAYVLYEFLQSKVGTRMIEGIQTGTTIKLLNNAQLARLEVPMFDIEFMNRIGEEIKCNKIHFERIVEESISIYQKNREELKEQLKFNF